MRGNPAPIILWAGVTGSIPACAGEPQPHQPHTRHRAVYPRVCGGTRSRRSSHPSMLGLSPRVRGNPDDREAPDVSARSIPACAGEPGTPRTTSAPLRVYPRVCGGTQYLDCEDLPHPGLSPRVRGNPPAGLILGRYNRSIPACAGEPLRGA